MLKKAVFITLGLLFAFAVLFISILRTAAVKYSFSSVKADSSDENIIKQNDDLGKMEIDYYLAYPGTVLPNHPLWGLKAFRDRLWLILTTDISKKSDLNLLFADKRLGSAKILFEKAEYELGITTLSKAEKYLEKASQLEEEARVTNVNTASQAKNLANASLKHRQIIRQIILLAPDDAKPKIVLIENITRGIYSNKKDYLEKRGDKAPNNPFNGD